MNKIKQTEQKESNTNNSNPILDFWFGNDFKFRKWWFTSNEDLDQEIYNKYYQEMVNTFINFNKEKYHCVGPIKLITDIILLDQFSRNISRIINQIDIPAYTEKAEILSNIWIEKKYYLTEPIAYTVFAFLPIRHTRDKNKIHNLLPLLVQCKPLEQNQIYNKFLTHTLRALQQFDSKI